MNANEYSDTEATPVPAEVGPAIEQQPSACYTPGCAKEKLAMIALGVLLFAFGMSELWTPLRLVIFGGRAAAEATRVIKTKAGLPELVLTDDLQVQAKSEANDRSYVFWNEFRFQTAELRDVTVRLPIGSQIKPLYPLFDEDGLPSSVTLYYDRRSSSTVVVPAVFSTWFMPGAFALAGLACIVIGGVLLRSANKPIDLPHFAGK